jgi:hypothetical protein
MEELLMRNLDDRDLASSTNTSLEITRAIMETASIEMISKTLARVVNKEK